MLLKLDRMKIHPDTHVKQRRKCTGLKFWNMTNYTNQSQIYCQLVLEILLEYISNITVLY